MTKKKTAQAVGCDFDITALPRSAVRYAIFRHRTGNAEPEHEQIYAYYAEKLAPFDLDFSSFTEQWDIHPHDNTQLVSGLDLKPLRARVEGSLFNKDGTLKDA